MSVQSKFIETVRSATKRNYPSPTTLIFKGAKGQSRIVIPHVNEARRFPGGQISTVEPHTSIVLEKRVGLRTNISLRADVQESFLKGNKRGIESLSPGITRRFMKALHTRISGMDLEEGEEVPLILGKLKPAEIELLYVGRKATGGPVHYVYDGSGEGEYDEDTGVVIFDGDLLDPKVYSKTKKLFLRAEPIYEDQGWAPDLKLAGIPLIYGPSKKYKIADFQLSIVEEDKSPEAIGIVEL